MLYFSPSNPQFPPYYPPHLDPLPFCPSLDHKKRKGTQEKVKETEIHLFTHSGIQ